MKNIISISFFLGVILFSCSKDISSSNELLNQVDVDLINKLQEDVFTYFWDYTHQYSKLSRERIHENNISFDENTVTTGGSGFGFLNILIGIENQFKQTERYNLSAVTIYPMRPSSMKTISIFKKI